MDWTTILCRKAVCDAEQEFCNEFHAVVLPENDTLSQVLKSGQIDSKRAILVTNRKADWQEAKQLGLATLPYRQKNRQNLDAFEGAWMVAEGLADVDEEFLELVYVRAHDLPWVALTTPRCYLRELTMDDMDALFALYAGKGICDYMEPLYPRAQEEAYEQAYIQNMYRFYGYGMWLVCQKDTGKIIGRAGLEHRDYEGITELEMGYMIATDEQQKGYATEVCEGLLAFAETHLPFEQITCLIQKENQVSVHLAEKLGFSFQKAYQEDKKTMLRYVRKLHASDRKD